MNRFTTSAAALCLAAAAFVGAPAAQAQSPLSLASLLSIDPVPPSSYGRATPETAPIPRRDRQLPDRHAPARSSSARQSRLYLVLGDGKALRYGVGVGPAGFEWKGEQRITMKREWPDWRPPRIC